jgi:hypothetical protein
MGFIVTNSMEYDLDESVKLRTSLLLRELWSNIKYSMHFSILWSKFFSRHFRKCACIYGVYSIEENSNINIKPYDKYNNRGWCNDSVITRSHYNAVYNDSVITRSHYNAVYNDSVITRSHYNAV